MRAPIRDTRNILFHSSALTTSTSNITLDFNIDIANDSVITDIIYNDSDKKNEVRGYSPYGLYLIELRYHILYKYGRFNSYWNLRKNSLSHFIMFLEFNLSAFTFSNFLV